MIPPITGNTMSNKTDLMIGFERGVKCAVNFIKSHQRGLTAEIDFLNYKLGHGHNMTNYERQSEQEKRHALTVSLKELNELHDLLTTLFSVEE